MVDEHKSKVGELEARNAEAEKQQEELAERKEQLLAALHNVPGLENADTESAVDALHTKVQESSEEVTKLDEQNKKLVEQRRDLNKDVSDAQTEFKAKKNQNDRFLEAYRRNGDEYTVAAVNPRWRFVVFNAGGNSGFFPGDTTPLLVQRDGIAIATLRIVSVSGGQVVAEYDEDSLPRGVSIEVGDRVLRKVPVGS